MSKSLIPHPDRAKGVGNEVKSQGFTFVVGAATGVFLIPMFGWFIGPVVGIGGLIAWKAIRRKKR